MDSINVVSCKDFVSQVTLDRTWRNGDDTTILVSAWEILNSPLFSRNGEVWYDECGNGVMFEDIENLKQKYETITE
jgi:hypothetical protein